MQLTIEKIPSSVPPMDCDFRDGEEAVYRIETYDVVSSKHVICKHHMKQYLMEVVEGM